MEKDRDLRLHDEAQAREKWRGGETIIAKGADRADLPASEVDPIASTDAGGEAKRDPSPGRFAERRPPD